MNRYRIVVTVCKNVINTLQKIKQVDKNWKLVAAVAPPVLFPVIRNVEPKAKAPDVKSSKFDKAQEEDEN